MEKLQEIMQAQSQIMDNEIRNLCRTYGFDPENIRDTPYRLVIEQVN